MDNLENMDNLDCDHKCDTCQITILTAWAEKHPEVKDLLDNPDIVRTMELAVKELGKTILVIPIPIFYYSLCNIAQFCFVLGYKRGLDTMKLEQTFTEKKQ